MFHVPLAVLTSCGWVCSRKTRWQRTAGDDATHYRVLDGIGVASLHLPAEVGLVRRMVLPAAVASLKIRRLRRRLVRRAAAESGGSW